MAMATALADDVTAWVPSMVLQPAEIESQQERLQKWLEVTLPESFSWASLMVRP